MKTYQYYKAEDFLTDSWFLAWVKHNQPDARQFWEEWLQQNPDQRDTLLLAKDMAEALKNRPHTLSPEHEQLEVEQIVRMARHVSSQPSQPVFRQIGGSYGWVAAALIVLLAGIGWWAIQHGTLPKNHALENDVADAHKPLRSDWINQANGTSQPVRIMLPDGSRMTLMANSQASYPRRFDTEKREVHLKGDALFSVVHEGKRPFLVYSGTLVTRVLGTQFRVQARPGDRRMTVSVICGKVSVMDRKDWNRAQVSPANAKAGVVLTANQQVTYDATLKSYLKDLVPKPMVVGALANPETFHFDDTPAITVFERLKKAYGVEIIYDASAIRHCTLTASLADVSLYDQLQLLCASIGATYEVVDTRIIITSKGC